MGLCVNEEILVLVDSNISDNKITIARGFSTFLQQQYRLKWHNISLHLIYALTGISPSSGVTVWWETLNPDLNWEVTMLFDPQGKLFLSICCSNVRPHNPPVSIINMCRSMYL